MKSLAGIKNLSTPKFLVYLLRLQFIIIRVVNVSLRALMGLVPVGYVPKGYAQAARSRGDVRMTFISAELIWEASLSCLPAAYRARPCPQKASVLV